MENATMIAIPQRALRRLEFLAGEYQGTQTLYPPGGKRVSYDAQCTVSREACERFVKIEFFAEVPQLGIESFTAFLTYSTRKDCYEMWLFSSSAEEPLHMSGDFDGRQLVMISDPWSMPWGLQRLRGTYTPHADGCFEYLAELWDPDGYTKFRRTVFHERSKNG
jgi:hypothetical protein